VNQFTLTKRGQELKIRLPIWWPFSYYTKGAVEFNKKIDKIELERFFDANQALMT
jgi:hypothetical protein